jgi:hypothetical protein
MKKLLMLLLIPCFIGVISIGCDDDSSVPADMNGGIDLCKAAGDAGHC